MKREWMSHPARICSITIITVALVLLVLGQDTVKAEGSSEVGAEKTLTRNLEPVIVAGKDLSWLANTPVDDLFVYVFDGTEWQQIPAQVDEVNEFTGRYVASEDGLFDSNDEIVFIAADTSHEAPTGTVLSDELPVRSIWYEVKVTDPVDNTREGWAYIVASSQLNVTNLTDYVDFDNNTSRVTGLTYTLGFATPRPWADYLSLGDSGVDILDRNKLRLICLIPILCPITEETGNASVPNAPIKDGNVRIIIRDGRVLGYGSMISWSTGVPLTVLLAGDVRISFDFSAEVDGSTLYNAAVPAGVTVDGTDDVVPETPVNSWFQLSTTSGTVIQVANLATLGGTPTLLNYYEDSLAADATDTGDGARHGEIGTIIRYPVQSFPSSITYNFNLYTFAESEANIGATYEEYSRRPLIAATTLQSSEPLDTFYLPMLGND